MQSAVTSRALGLNPVIVEKEGSLGGKLNRWDRLFPTMTPAAEVLEKLHHEVAASGAEVLTSHEVDAIGEGGRSVTLTDGTVLTGDAVIVASGSDIFPAEIKEEYGYKIYQNVYTTVDIERMFREGGIHTADGRTPQTVAFLHCVGSRDEKVCQPHCSRVCCVTGVKQAIELKQAIEGIEVYNFYMDMRMFGPGYEELYREAQQTYNIHFVRGRISEASETIEHRIQIKAEDTLVGRPLKMTVDMLILIVGMKAGASNRRWRACPGIEEGSSEYLRPVDLFTRNCQSGADGVFYAGTVTAPKNIGESIDVGVAAACSVAEMLKNR